MCKGITKKGGKCKNKINSNNEYCYLHINKKDKTNSIFKLPNEIIFIIYSFLDIQSQLYISKTCKKFYDIFKSIFCELTIGSINDIINECINELFRKKVNFKGIYIIYLYYIKSKGLKFEGNITFCGFYIIVFIGKKKLKLDHVFYGVNIFLGGDKLYSIMNDKWIIKDFLNIIDLISDDLKKNKICKIENVTSIFDNYELDISKRLRI